MSVTPDAQLAMLIDGASRGPETFGMTGPDRAMAYRLVLATGFRADEIRSLTPESFRLDVPHPRIVLRPADEKARRGVEQPCPAVLADDLRRWLVGKEPCQSVLPLHPHTARMIRGDLEAVGIPYETDAGIFDFHALGGSFLSRVERSGASVKTFQTLARHAKAETTLARYAKASDIDLVGAVEALPNLGTSAPHPSRWWQRERTPNPPRSPRFLPTICPPEGTDRVGRWRILAR